MRLIPVPAFTLLCVLLLAAFPAGAGAQASDGPRHVILIIPDGMTRANEAGLSWYLNGQAAGDFSLSFHRDWMLRVPVTTWSASSYNKYAAVHGRPDFDPAVFSPGYGYDPQRGGGWPLLHPDPTTDGYILHGQAGPDASGSQPATDSAAAATALACGIKVTNGTLCWDHSADAPLENIGDTVRAQRGERAGLGIVSTVPISHATPAGFSAHDAKRGNYHWIAHDQLLHLPDVLLGGGHPLYDRDYLDGKAPKYLTLEQYAWLKAHPALVFCERQEGVAAAPALEAAAQHARATSLPLAGLFGGTSGALNKIMADPNQPDGFDYGTPENPGCWELARAALTVLSDSARFPDGFFLLIEQGDLDWANHDGNWAWGLGCMQDTERCARELVAWIEAGEGHGLTADNTLILLVADHGHYHRLDPQWRPAARELPAGAAQRADPAADDEYRRRYSPDGEVVYSRALNHSNELVMLYAWGGGGREALRSLFMPYLGRSYRDTQGVAGAIDNTAVYRIMQDWLGLATPAQPGIDPPL